jgi:phage terminase large subunit-like protein
VARRASSTRGRKPDISGFSGGRIPGYDPATTAGDCRFDKAAAKRAIAFFGECLTFTAGEWMGRPFELQPWQQAIVGNIFGWKRPNGTRRYREVFIYVPRKCGKSEMAGGLGNLLTFADGEPGAQVYCAAADREQARLVFNAARTMVQNEPELSSRSRIYTNAIMVEATGSVLKVVSAEAYTKHGVNAHGVIIDELHAQPTRELVDVLTTSTGARRQPVRRWRHRRTTSQRRREARGNGTHRRPRICRRVSAALWRGRLE